MLALIRTMPGPFSGGSPRSFVNMADAEILQRLSMKVLLNLYPIFIRICPKIRKKIRRFPFCEGPSVKGLN